MDVHGEGSERRPGNQASGREPRSDRADRWRESEREDRWRDSCPMCAIRRANRALRDLGAQPWALQNQGGYWQARPVPQSQTQGTVMVPAIYSEGAPSSTSGVGQQAPAWSAPQQDVPSVSTTQGTPMGSPASGAPGLVEMPPSGSPAMGAPPGLAGAVMGSPSAPPAIADFVLGEYLQ